VSWRLLKMYFEEMVEHKLCTLMVYKQNTKVSVRHQGKVYTFNM